jgi:hypothetical protein
MVEVRVVTGASTHEAVEGSLAGATVFCTGT